MFYFNITSMPSSYTFKYQVYFLSFCIYFFSIIGYSTSYFISCILYYISYFLLISLKHKEENKEVSGFNLRGFNKGKRFFNSYTLVSLYVEWASAFF